MDDAGSEALFEELLLLLEAQTEALRSGHLREMSPEQLLENRKRYDQIKDLLNRIGLAASGDPPSDS